MSDSNGWHEDFELEDRRMSDEHRQAEADYRRAEAMGQTEEDSLCSDSEEGGITASPDEVSKDADPF